MAVAENELTKVARIAAHAAQGVTIKDADGKQQNILPSGDKNMIDLSGISFGGNTGGDTGGGDNPDHPSAGADYYAGSLADGEITERELLWQGESDPTTTTNATLLKDVGAKFNSGGEGAFILVHLLKTVMTAGVKGATSEVKLNYDVNNVAKDGYYTTTSCYPIYIHAADLATHQELIVPLNGIGENLSGINVKAPELHIKYNDDKTIDITSVTGYDNDGAESGATGANYDVVSDLITTFSTQNAVAQLPASINLFTGSATGNITLAGATDYFENVMDGIELTFDDYIHESGKSDRSRIAISKLGLEKTIRLPKEILAVNNNISVFNNRKEKGLSLKLQTLPGVGSTTWIDNDTYIYDSVRYVDPDVNISDGAINFDLSIYLHIRDSNEYPWVFKLKLLKVTPYKN